MENWKQKKKRESEERNQENESESGIDNVWNATRVSQCLGLFWKQNGNSKF